MGKTNRKVRDNRTRNSIARLRVAQRKVEEQDYREALAYHLETLSADRYEVQS